MSLGDQIKQHRKTKSLSQLQLAEILGVSLRTLIRYEKDETQPNYEIKTKLTQLLDHNFLSQNGNRPTQASQPELSLKELRDKYLADLKGTVKHNTYRRYRATINEFIEIVGDPISIEFRHLTLYRKHTLVTKTINGAIKEFPRSIGGVVSNLNQIRIMLNWGRDMGYINRVCAFPKISKPRAKPKRILSNDEISYILKCDMDQEDKQLVELFLHTGARATEFLKENFTWDDYDPKNRMVHLGEGNKYHKVELTDRAVEILESWRHRETPLPYTYTYIRKHITRASVVSGVSFTAHTLRGASGAILLRNGASIYEVSKFLGHSGVSVTEKHYIDLLKKDYQELSNRLSRGINKLQKFPDSGIK